MWSLAFCFASMAAFSCGSPPNMIVIMLDGFRWDYPTIYGGEGLPGLERFSRNGVRAKYLNPVFPANTFPNWHTMVTGLYPESHGMVGNYMFDLERGKAFSQDREDLLSDPLWWKGAEPLWITATRSQVDTALILWERCDVPWEGTLPRFCEPYSYVSPRNACDFRRNLGRSLDMVELQGFRLVMLYEWIVDTVGHIHGPGSSEVATIVKEVDVAMQDFWRELEARDLIDNTNVVLLSDHGMTSTSHGAIRAVEVGRCLRGHEKQLRVAEFGGYAVVSVRGGDARKVAESVRSCEGVSDKVTVHRKEDLPNRYHYKSHRLIGDVIVIAKPGYSISMSGIQEKLPEKEPRYEGGHGFDNTQGQNPDMRGVLFAHGPSFASGLETEGVEQVDVYGLLCRGLHLSCRPNNGSWDRIESFFSCPREEKDSSTGAVSVALFIFSSFVLAGIAYAMGVY